MCRQCKQAFVPKDEGHRWGSDPACPFCGDRDDLLSPVQAMEEGLLDPDGAGYWRVRHGPVPGGAQEARPIPHLEDDDGGRSVRLATYTRISTDEDRQPFSLGAQTERLEAYARSQDGWRIVRRYSDQASGATLTRPELKKALEEASAGVYELLLVYRVDRLSRNVRQLAQIAEDLDRVDVSLRSAT